MILIEANLPTIISEHVALFLSSFIQSATHTPNPYSDALISIECKKNTAKRQSEAQMHNS